MIPQHLLSVKSLVLRFYGCHVSVIGAPVFSTTRGWDEGGIGRCSGGVGRACTAA
jgi:hypothetical protein